ncbi:hypothetical protein CLV60_1042 [Dyadobacter jiangsuensis]|uniref:Uncharacterized protein n=1 Tax=Dyadobacter jiangsuensis TaxID=1591085 RepID=A0A2P8G7V0_9BACT|nr:hypothetical protein CLV60_1042 [Dyadobacter jiangsuensis]
MFSNHDMIVDFDSDKNPLTMPGRPGRFVAYAFAICNYVKKDERVAVLNDLVTWASQARWFTAFCPAGHVLPRYLVELIVKNHHALRMDLVDMAGEDRRFYHLVIRASVLDRLSAGSIALRPTCQRHAGPFP